MLLYGNVKFGDCGLISVWIVRKVNGVFDSEREDLTRKR